MTCLEFDRLVAVYFDCRLSHDQVTTFYSHAVGCVECRQYLQGYRRVVVLLKEEQRTK